jgi:hypothetical protein
MKRAARHPRSRPDSLGAPYDVIICLLTVLEAQEDDGVAQVLYPTRLSGQRQARNGDYERPL